MRHSRWLLVYRSGPTAEKSLKTTKKRVESANFWKNWTAKDFSGVVWRGESMFELEKSFNPQNGRAWLEKVSVPPRLLSRHPAKIIVRGTMSAQALTDLHVVPRSSL